MTERERKLRMLTLIPFFARRLVSGRTARALVACLMLVAGHAAHAAIPIQHWQHASGAKVYLVESPVIPMLDVQIDVDGGSRRDPAGQAGLASATADMLSAGTLAHEGQSALDEHQLAEAWTDLGASFGAEVSGERFTLSLRTLTEPALLRQAVALAARQMAVPAWPGPVWQRDRERWAQALREADMRPGTHADRAFGQAVYGDHPLGRPTTPETLAAFGVDDMRAFYRQHVAACRANVTLVGAINRQTADDIVGRLISAIAPNGCPRLAPVPAVEPLQAAVEQRMPFDAAQAQVLIGQPGIARSDPDYFPLFVGNYILGGGGFVSRLMTEVREKRGLTYGVYSTFMPGLQPGPFQIGLTTRPDQAAQAVALVREVVARFVAEGPTEDELRAAKGYLVNSFALRIDSNRKLLGNVANIAWNGLPLDYLDTWTDQVKAVTTADIRRAFGRVLQPEHLVTVVVGGR